MLAATEGIQRESAVRYGTAGHLRECGGLLVQRCCRAQLSRECAHPRARVERKRKGRQRPGVTSNLDLTCSERIPAFVVPDERGYPAREPEPARVLLRGNLLRADGAHRPLQHRHSARWPVNGQQRHPLEQQIPRVRRLWRTGAAENRLGYLEGIAAARQASGEQRGDQRVEVGGARELGVERFELAGGTEQQWGSVAATPCGESDLTAQQMHTCALEVVEGASLGGGEQRERVLESARFVLGLRRHQRPLRPSRWVECQG